jgi:hypothetical protein
MQIEKYIADLIDSLSESPYYPGQDRQDMLRLLEKDYL